MSGPHGRRALLRPDGARRYSDAEHAEREQSLQAEFKRTISSATEAASAASLEASTVLDRGDSDPVHKLTTADLEQASLLKALLRERMLTAPLRDVDAEVQHVLASGDRASRFAVWALVSERRQLRVEAAIASAPDLSARLRAEHGPEAGPLGSMQARLYETLADVEARSAVREEAQALRDQALAIQSRAATTSYLQDAYGPRPQGWRPDAATTSAAQGA